MRHRQYRVLAGLLGIFILPWMLACFWFFGGKGQTERTNQGHWVTSAVAAVTLPPAAKWRLVYAPGRACDTSCLQEVDQVARVRLALGRHLYGIGLALLLPAGAAEPGPSDRARLQDMDVQIIRAGGAQVGAGQKALQLPTDKIWIVNEKGQSILSYASATQDATALFADLKQLSRLWKE